MLVFSKVTNNVCVSWFMEMLCKINKAQMSYFIQYTIQEVLLEAQES